MDRGAPSLREEGVLAPGERGQERRGWRTWCGARRRRGRSGCGWGGREVLSGLPCALGEDGERPGSELSAMAAGTQPSRLCLHLSRPVSPSPDGRAAVGQLPGPAHTSARGRHPAPSAHDAPGPWPPSTETSEPARSGKARRPSWQEPPGEAPGPWQAVRLEVPVVPPALPSRDPLPKGGRSLRGGSRRRPRSCRAERPGCERGAGGQGGRPAPRVQERGAPQTEGTAGLRARGAPAKGGCADGKRGKAPLTESDPHRGESTESRALGHRGAGREPRRRFQAPRPRRPSSPSSVSGVPLHRAPRSLPASKPSEPPSPALARV